MVELGSILGFGLFSNCGQFVLFLGYILCIFPWLLIAWKECFEGDLMCRVQC